MLFVCWGHFYVFLVFTIFLTNHFFLIYKTQVALFSVHTVPPPLQLWVSQILISTQTYFLTGQDLQLFTVQPVSRLFPKSASPHCITVSYLMTLKCHMSFRKQNKHKNKGKKQRKNGMRQLYRKRNQKKKSVNKRRLYTNCL